MRWKACQCKQWRSWFAWYPVCLKGEWVWLERIEWRDVGSYDVQAEYRTRRKG